MPVYEVYCRDCGMSWVLGENELIDFFARQRRATLNSIQRGEEDDG